MEGRRETTANAGTVAGECPGILSHLKNDISMCVLYRARTWRRPDSHVLCVPRRGFPRFAIPESRRDRPPIYGRKPGSAATGHPRSAEGKNNRLVARFHSPAWRDRRLLSAAPSSSTQKPFEDRRNHENSTLNIFAREMMATLKLAISSESIM